MIVDPAEGRRVLTVFVEEFNRRHGPDSPWPEALADDWVERSPLAKVAFVETDCQEPTGSRFSMVCTTPRRTRVSRPPCGG